MQGLDTAQETIDMLRMSEQQRQVDTMMRLMSEQRVAALHMAKELRPDSVQELIDNAKAILAFIRGEE